jgi:ferrous iron transport protein B
MANNIIALAGNPNAGKSTIFNALTGARQRVGNWPGKTVEKKEGVFSHNQIEMTVVDLPGTYSLSAYSLEEEIARDFLIEEHPQVVVNVVDASNLERNLYLTVQILETGLPLILVLNMLDIATARNITIDTDRLTQLLGVPVIPMVARNDRGLDALKDSLVSLVQAYESSSSSPPDQPTATQSSASPNGKTKRMPGKGCCH